MCLANVAATRAVPWCAWVKYSHTAWDFQPPWCWIFWRGTLLLKQKVAPDLRKQWKVIKPWGMLRIWRIFAKACLIFCWVTEVFVRGWTNIGEAEVWGNFLKYWCKVATGHIVLFLIRGIWIIWHSLRSCIFFAHFTMICAPGWPHTTSPLVSCLEWSNCAVVSGAKLEIRRNVKNASRNIDLNIKGYCKLSQALIIFLRRLISIIPRCLILREPLMVKDFCNNCITLLSQTEASSP